MIKSFASKLCRSVGLALLLSSCSANLPVAKTVPQEKVTPAQKRSLLARLDSIIEANNTLVTQARQARRTYLPSGSVEIRVDPSSSPLPSLTLAPDSDEYRQLSTNLITATGALANDYRFLSHITSKELKPTTQKLAKILEASDSFAACLSTGSVGSCLEDAVAVMPNLPDSTLDLTGLFEHRKSTVNMAQNCPSLLNRANLTQVRSLVDPAIYDLVRTPFDAPYIEVFETMRAYKEQHQGHNVAGHHYSPTNTVALVLGSLRRSANTYAHELGHVISPLSERSLLSQEKYIKKAKEIRDKLRSFELHNVSSDSLVKDLKELQSLDGQVQKWVDVIYASSDGVTKNHMPIEEASAFAASLMFMDKALREISIDCAIQNTAYLARQSFMSRDLAHVPAYAVAYEQMLATSPGTYFSAFVDATLEQAEEFSARLNQVRDSLQMKPRIGPRLPNTQHYLLQGKRELLLDEYEKNKGKGSFYKERVHLLRTVLLPEFVTALAAYDSYVSQNGMHLEPKTE